jgi:Site-specific recombinase XerD
MASTRGEGGCLEPYVEGFRSRLPELGYTAETVRIQVRWLRRLGRWLSAEGLEASDLSEVRVEAYLAARRLSGGRWVEGVGCYRALLDYLRGEGVMAPGAAQPPTELEQLGARYRNWLVRDRALAPATVQRYERLAHRFLQERAGGGNGLNVEALGGGDVAAFLLSECARLRVGSAKGKVAELRSLMRFLYLEGLTQRQLAVAVPPVGGWSGGRVPPSMSASDVQALLDSCDRSHHWACGTSPS